MKKCLLMFFGLPRTFEECSENINKNLLSYIGNIFIIVNNHKTI